MLMILFMKKIFIKQGNNMDCYKIIQEHNACSKVKLELKKAGVNYYKNESFEVLQARLAFSRNHQPSKLKKLLFLFKK